jgi:hypothetical protein
MVGNYEPAADFAAFEARFPDSILPDQLLNLPQLAFLPPCPAKLGRGTA